MQAVRRPSCFVAVRLLDEATLKQRYGSLYNPFIAVPRAITPVRFVVFKANIEEVSEPLVLELRRTVFAMGNTAASAMPLSVMKDYWAQEDEDLGIRGTEVDTRDRILREEMMPDRVVLPAGGRVSRLLVFAGNFPRTGEGKLTIPLLGPRGELVDKLEFTFTFEPTF